VNPRTVHGQRAWTRAVLFPLLATVCGTAIAADAIEQWRALDPAVAARVLALSPERITDVDVRETLSHAPAPRVIAIEGSLALVSMRPFAEFLVAMGYPEDRLRNPHDGSLSQGSFTDSARLAGEIAWYYEHDGMMPMLIGHSQGGMLAVRTLHELAGEFASAIPVWDPVRDEPLPRTTIRDPLTGATRPVVGLKIGYAAALATGKLPRVLLGQWTMLPRLRRIPDSVEEFTGFTIPGDVIAGNLFGDEPYSAIGDAQVRNLTLPASYSHIGLPRVRHLAAQASTREWIERYAPAMPPLPLPAHSGVDISNLVHAADIWHDVKKRWCLEAQRAIRAASVTP
jgi:hypothetical protein